MTTRLLASLSVVGLLACGGGESAPQSPTPAASSTGQGEPSASKSADASAWSPPSADPTPAQVQRECGPLVDALRKATEGQDLSADILSKSLAEVAKNPPMPAPQFEWCKALTEKDIARIAEQEKKIETVEASPDIRGKATVAKIAKAMAMVYEHPIGGAKPKLCPSAKPVPAKLPVSGESAPPSADEWKKDAGWSCLGFSLVVQDDFQYEVKVTGKTFTAYARRRDGKDVVAYSAGGKVDPKDPAHVLLEPNVAEKRTKGPKP